MLEVCKSLAENRGYNFNKGYIYSTELDLTTLHPVIFEFDTMDWGAYDISAQILAKFGKGYQGGTKLYGATDIYDEEDDSYWSDDIDPKKVIIKPLLESDLLIISEINKNAFMAKFGANYETKIGLFNQLMEVLAKYGYNCIKYKNYGENYNGSDSYIFPNNYIFDNLICTRAGELKESLLEDTRVQLASASRNAGAYKDQSHGKNRFERKKLSKIAANVKQYNNINMNDLFKHDVLQVEIPVIGETDTYKVTVKMEGVVAEIAKNIKNNKYKLEFRTIIQSLTKVFNTAQIYINCTCLAKDTKIKLLDGTEETIENLKTRFDNGEQLYVYSVDENGDFKPGIVEGVYNTGTTNVFYEVTLDNGEVIRTTPEHPYLLRSGEYVEAKNLQIGDSLMPLYFEKTNNGYETVKFNSTGKYHSIYKVVGNYFYPEQIQQKEQQALIDQENKVDKMPYLVAIHHKDFNKANNNPENLQIMTGYEHWLYHANTIGRL